MKLRFAPDFNTDEFKKSLNKDLYFILQGTENFQWKCTIIRNNHGFFIIVPHMSILIVLKID